MDIREGLKGFSNELFRKIAVHGLKNPEFAKDIRHIDKLVDEWVNQNKFQEIVLNDNDLMIARSRYKGEELEMLHHYTAAKLLSVTLFKMLKEF